MTNKSDKIRKICEENINIPSDEDKARILVGSLVEHVDNRCDRCFGMGILSNLMEEVGGPICACEKPSIFESGECGEKHGPIYCDCALGKKLVDLLEDEAQQKLREGVEGSYEEERAEWDFLSNE